MAWSRGKSYAQDLRERVFAIADGGASVSQTALLLRVSISYVSKVLSRRRQTGEVAARPQHCHLPRKLADLHGAIGAQVTSLPDATIAELRAWLLATHKVSASTGLMHKTLVRLGLSFKKSPCGRPNRIAPTLPRPAPRGARTSPV
jgi:transposase